MECDNSVLAQIKVQHLSLCLRSRGNSILTLIEFADKTENIIIDKQDGATHMV